MRQVLVNAYPKSGVTWLLRLVCDLLEARHQDTSQMSPLSYGHPVRDGWVVKKTHYPYWQHAIPILKGKIVVVTHRDPRDVVCSAMFYRKTTDLKLAINVMASSKRSYAEWINSWIEPVEPLKCKRILTSYERLHSEPLKQLRYIIFEISGETLPDERINEAIDRQSFKNMRKSYNDGGHFMRKGIVGDWRNHFDRETAQIFNDHFGEIMLLQGYIDDLEWWKDVKV